MSTLHINLGARSYDIINSAGALRHCGKLASAVLRGKRVCIVSDTNVAPIYGEAVCESFREAGLSPFMLVIPAGEHSKSPSRLAWLWEEMAGHGITRADSVVALGGGVVGDLTGFAAATMLRGIDFIQIPTTLLAQVDSSVGGKVAVDLNAGKNLAGCFYQPKLVIIDTDVLSTLSDRTFADGMAEVIKYGCIFDRALFEQLGSYGNRNRVMRDIEQVVTSCCDSKRKTVEQDEFDTGIRMLLNFGHTFGHVYEKAYHYERYTHGEAVAAGMVDAVRVGEALGMTAAGTASKIISILEKYQLPTKISASFEDYETLIALDKKSEGSKIQFVALAEIGEARTVCMEKKQLLSVMRGVV